MRSHVQAVLAAIILVACKRRIMQVKQAVDLWRVSIYEFVCLIHFISYEL